MISLGQISYFAALDDLWCHLKLNTLTWVFQHISSICAGVVQCINNTYLLSDNHTFEPHCTVTSSCSLIIKQLYEVNITMYIWFESVELSLFNVHNVLVCVVLQLQPQKSCFVLKKPNE